MAGKGKTFSNNIDEQEVSLAIERFLVASVGQSWSPARVDLDSLPTGFRDLGAVVEDSVSVSAERTNFQLDAGLPQVRQFEETTAIDASVSFQLHSFSWRKLQYALGNYSAVSSATAMGTIASVTDAGVVTLSSTTPAASLSVGDHVVIAASGEEDFADATETQIVSIENDNKTYHFEPTLLVTPSDNDNVYKYDYVVQHFGTAKNTNYQLLGVADFTNGAQLIHHFPKVAPAASVNEEIRPDQNQRINLEFSAFGTTQSVQGNDELVTHMRYHFPKTGS